VNAGIESTQSRRSFLFGRPEWKPLFRATDLTPGSRVDRGGVRAVSRPEGFWVEDDRGAIVPARRVVEGECLGWLEVWCGDERWPSGTMLSHASWERMSATDAKTGDANA